MATFQDPPSLPNVEGGTHPPGPETYRNPVLRAHGRAIAEATTRLFFQAWPELQQRYGERGRQFTYQDNYWHFSTLDAAWRLKSPAMWLEYVQWLRTFILSRGMTDAVTCANFVFFKRLLLELDLPEDQATARTEVIELLDAAIALFKEEDRVPPGRDDEG